MTVTIKTHRLNVWFRCLKCEITLQNPTHPYYPSEWIREHRHPEPKQLALIEKELVTNENHNQ